MFRTIQHVGNHKHGTILTELRKVIQLYMHRGFQVCDIHADHEFECVRDDIPIHFEIVAADSHVGEIERANRTTNKERARACTHGLPFRRLPKLLLVSMLDHVTLCLNMFPAPNGVSDTISPLSLVTGAPRSDFARLTLEFGAYVQLFDDFDPTNTLRSRTFGAIALLPTGNEQGDYHFLLLVTGFRVSRHCLQELPIPATAIAQVEALAKLEKQLLIQASGLVVEWRPDHPVDDNAYDHDFNGSDDPADDPFDPDEYSVIDADELAHLDDPFAVHAAPVPQVAPPPIPIIADQGAPYETVNNNAFEDNEQHTEFDNEEYPEEEEDQEADTEEPQEIYEDQGAHTEPQEDQGADTEEPQEMHEDQGRADTEPQDQGAYNAELDEQPQQQQVRYSLRNRTNPNSAAFKAPMDSPHNSKSYFPPVQLPYKDIFSYIMTQMESYTAEFAVTMTQANVRQRGHQEARPESGVGPFSGICSIGGPRCIQAIESKQAHQSTKEVRFASDQSHQGETLRPPQRAHRG